MGGFTPKGFLSVPAAIEAAGKHLCPNSWTGGETTAAVLGFDQRHFDGEIDAYMIGWLVAWQGERLGADWWRVANEGSGDAATRPPKARKGRRSRGRRPRRRSADATRDQEAEWQAARQILKEARHVTELRQAGGWSWQTREKGYDSGELPGLPWELSIDDIETIARTEAEHIAERQGLLDAHERLTRTTLWVRQQLRGTPPTHDDAVPSIEVYSDGKERSVDPQAWARPEASKLIRAALVAGDHDLMAKGGGGVSGQLFVSDELIGAPDQATETAPDVPHPGGRPPKWDWEGFSIELTRRIHDDGLPATQAEMVRNMLDWFSEKTGGNCPAESKVKSKVSKVYRAIRGAA